HVATREDGGNRLFLDWGRRLVPEAVDSSEKDRVETQMIERILRVRRLHRESYGFIGLRIRVETERIPPIIRPRECLNHQLPMQRLEGSYALHDKFQHERRPAEGISGLGKEERGRHQEVGASRLDVSRHLRLCP